MICGIGIDTVSIPEIARIISSGTDSFILKTFSESEREQATHRADQAEYLAGRFAVKEATFKAIAHLDTEGSFDLRIVSCVDDENGRPVIELTEPIKHILIASSVAELMVSITHEDDYATAIVLAQR